MKYPLHTVSKPVSGSEVEKLANAIKSGGYVANEAALALAKKIADRRHSQKLPMPPSSKFAGVDFTQLPVEHFTPDLTISGQGFRCLRGENLGT